MRSGLALVIAIGAVALTGTAQAQTPAGLGTSEPSRGYVEAVAQSAFGNVTSQSYGGEIGITIAYGVQLFVEAGRTRDVATTVTQAAAQQILSGLPPTLPGVVSHVKQPVTFGVAGIKVVPTDGAVQPYVMGGFGIARVKQEVSFTVNGSDVTANLPQAPYYVTLGPDLTGSITKPMLTLGGGVTWAALQHFALDFQFRYGRIFAEDQGINVTRAGLGVGVRF